MRVFLRSSPALLLGVVAAALGLAGELAEQERSQLRLCTEYRGHDLTGCLSGRSARRTAESTVCRCEIG